MKSWKIAIPAIAVVLLAVTGCSKTESKLVGKWQNERLPETVEFFDNKSGVFEEQNKPPLPFKWSAQDNQVKLDVAIGGAVKTLNGELNKDVFVLKSGNLTASYRKIK